MSLTKKNFYTKPYNRCQDRLYIFCIMASEQNRRITLLCQVYDLKIERKENYLFYFLVYFQFHSNFKHMRIEKKLISLSCNIEKKSAVIHFNKI